MNTLNYAHPFTTIIVDAAKLHGVQVKEINEGTDVSHILLLPDTAAKMAAVRKELSDFGAYMAFLNGVTHAPNTPPVLTLTITFEPLPIPPAMIRFNLQQLTEWLHRNADLLNMREVARRIDLNRVTLHNAVHDRKAKGGYTVKIPARCIPALHQLHSDLTRV